MVSRSTTQNEAYTPPQLRVTVSYDGKEITPSILDGKLSIRRGLLGLGLGNRITSIGGISFSYGVVGGRLTSIGFKKIHYGLLSGEVTKVTGEDPRVEIYLLPRPRPVSNPTPDTKQTR